MDPCALYAPKDKIDEIVLKMSKSFGFWGVTTDRGGKKGWIANLGHGIYPDVEPTHMKKFLEAIKTHTSSWIATVFVNATYSAGPGML